MFGIGGWELVVIAMVALLVLGPKGLPGAARALGKAFSHLRQATQDLRDTIELDPELRELPRTLDEINRPLLSPYPRKPRPPRSPADTVHARDGISPLDHGTEQPAAEPHEGRVPEAARPELAETHDPGSAAVESAPQPAELVRDRPAERRDTADRGGEA